MAMTTRTLIGRIDRDIRSAERDRDMLDRYLNGLRSAKQDLAGAVLKEAIAPKAQRHTRTEVLTEIFQQSQQPYITMDDIMKELQTRGRSDDRRSVHATLSYLKRQNVAKSVDRGKWAAIAA